MLYWAAPFWEPDFAEIPNMRMLSAAGKRFCPPGQLLSDILTAEHAAAVLFRFRRKELFYNMPDH